MRVICHEFIKQRRIELNITMQDMAKILGFKNASTYLKYENGEYSLKANHLPKLADTLKCKIDDLFFIKIISEIEIGANTA
ncbi:transcriptional regulator [Anaerobacillus arseniciselenatis]|uniref:Transcriptional regulator n=1 Tax=Anaerobacillus arseniciselenatis TaxID=85682 RepID=A0A1S2L6N8_9BACI|nr:helix-turn-helix transcriptional regulator [Anaerobacillus arseniciselenatis]OIJ07643.1 transcriptional regulator [Anaerobacillus arseniciselenatis]